VSTVLREALADYLALRRGLGYALVRDEKLLNQFIDWLDDHGRDRITVDDALAWVRLPEVASASWLRMRMRVVRGFAGYLRTVDPAHEVPPSGLLPCHVDRAVPYLYSESDIAALVIAVGQLKTPIRRATIATLIGLLTVTGMRLGEVVGLDDSDFDPAQGLLTVRRAKLGKHRLLPLHPSTVSAVDAYRRLREATFPHPVSAALLVSQAGTRLLNYNVGQTFARLARDAGLAARSPRCRPRPHDYAAHLRREHPAGLVSRRRRRRRSIAAAVHLSRPCRTGQHLLVSRGRTRAARPGRRPARDQRGRER
jgi:integrase/recombinase XerD